MPYHTQFQFPPSSIFQGEILGVDDNSYMHIDMMMMVGVQDMYDNMIRSMEMSVRNQVFMPRYLAKRRGTDCIIQFGGRRGGQLSRATVLGAEPTSDFVKCRVIDDFTDATVHISQMFPITGEVMNYPRFALKCRLFEMDLFIGTSCLKKLYQVYKTSSLDTVWNGNDNRCLVEVVDANPTPIVRMRTCDGWDLTNVLQQLMPGTFQLTYPPVGVPLGAQILHCERNGILWYRPHTWRSPYYDENIDPNEEGGRGDLGELSRAIKNRLGSLLIRPQTPKYVSLDIKENLWKKYYFHGEGCVYIYTTEDRSKSYRVTIWTPPTGEILMQQQMIVFFMDYGSFQAVDPNRLKACYRVDPSLCFLPPQALGVKFLAASCIGADQYAFDRKKLSNLLGDSPMSILIKKFQCATITDGFRIQQNPPITDILIKNHPAYAEYGHPGHSLGEMIHFVYCGTRSHHVFGGDDYMNPPTLFIESDTPVDKETGRFVPRRLDEWKWKTGGWDWAAIKDDVYAQGRIWKAV